MNRLSARAASAWALLGLSACSVGPAYKKPDLPPPTVWREAPPPDAEGIWPSADWRHGFGSQTLDELIAEAPSSNGELAAACARVEEADAQARIAGAPLLPSVDLGADASRQRAQVTGVGSETFNTDRKSV